MAAAGAFDGWPASEEDLVTCGVLASKRQKRLVGIILGAWKKEEGLEQNEHDSRISVCFEECGGAW